MRLLTGETWKPIKMPGTEEGKMGKDAHRQCGGDSGSLSKPCHRLALWSWTGQSLSLGTCL